MKTNILTMLMTLVVGVILAGSLLVPVIDSATTPEVPTNTSMSWKVSEADEWTLTNVSGGTNIINGVEVPQSGPTLWILADTVQVRIGADNRTSFISPNLSNTIAEGGTITFADGQCSITSGDYSYTFAFSKLYVPDENGTLGAFYQGSQFTVNKNYSDMFVCSLGFAADVTKNFTGTYDFKNETWDTLSEAKTVVPGGVPTAYNYSTEVSFITESNTNYTELVNLNVDDALINFVPKEGDTVAGNILNLYCIAPITPEITDSDLPAWMNLVKAIPILVIVALLITAVGAIAYRRAD